MYVTIDWSDGYYFFQTISDDRQAALDALGSGAAYTAPAAVSAEMVEFWQAVNVLSDLMQAQLRHLANQVHEECKDAELPSFGQAELQAIRRLVDLTRVADRSDEQ